MEEEKDLTVIDKKSNESGENKVKTEKKVKDRTVPAFVLGIVSVFFVFFGTRMSVVSIVCGIIGLVFSVKTKKSGAKRGLLTAAFVLSIVGLSFGAMSVLSFISCGILTCVLNKSSGYKGEIVNLVVDKINRLTENLIDGIVNIHIYH